MRFLPIVMILGLTAACGQRDYEEPKVETTVEYEPKPGTADATPQPTGGGLAGDTGSEATDVNQLKMLFQATVNGVDKVFTLTPEQVSGDVVLMMPNSYLSIPSTADDSYAFQFIYQVTPAHAFPRELSQVTGILETQYTEPGSSEKKYHRASLHSTRDFSWQAVTSGYAFGTEMGAKGLVALNKQIADAGLTVEVQYFRFELTMPSNKDKGMIIIIPVMIDG